MNKRFSRPLLTILSILLVLLLPAGCGGTSSVDEEKSFLGNSETTLNNSERETIKFYFPGAQPKSWPEVKAKIEEQAGDTVNVSLDFKWLEVQSYLQKMDVLDASGDQFDAFCLGKPDRTFLDFTRLAREGKLKDISQLFNANAPALKQKYTEEELSYGQVDGKLYALPSLYPHAYATYLMVDEALMNKYNISDITTYDKYEAYLKAVKENEPDLIPGIIANSTDTLNLFARGSGYVIVDELQKLVYKWDDPEMKVLAWEKTPEFKEAVYYLADWFKKGYLAATQDQSKVTSFIFYGDMSPSTSETTKMSYNTPTGDIKESNPLRMFYLYPEKKVQRENPMGRFFFNGSFVFPSSSVNTERALQFVDWVQQSRDNYYLMMYGIEGKDYVKDAAYGYPGFPEGMDYNSRTYLYWDGNWAINNIGYEPIPKDKDGKEMEGRKQFLDKNSKYPPHGALYPDYEKIQTAADSRTKRFNEFENKIRQGQLADTSEIDSFIKELEALGTDNLVAEVQKQLEEAVKARK
jgi:putative aldouronate transport system substrate-binding protein